MKHPVRILSIIAALGLLVAIFATAEPVQVEAAAVTVAENQVEWANNDGTGANITHVKPGITAHFYIRDDVLQTTRTGTAEFGSWNSDTGAYFSATYFNIPTGGASTRTPIGHGVGLGAASLRTVNRALSAIGYGTTLDGQALATTTATSSAVYNASSTPLTGAPTLKDSNNNDILVMSSNTARGTFQLVGSGVTATSTATFSYHVVDQYLGTASASRRAKVTSTSDPSGEWITINEVDGVGLSGQSSTSTVFQGTIALSTDAAVQGTNSDGIWVNDGDTLTTTYYKSDGTVLDSDTVKVDSVKPSVTGITPADGTVTNIANPTVQFDVTDTNSGMGATPASVISLGIVSAAGATTTVATADISYQAIADGYRAIFAQGVAWTEATGSGGYAVTDSTEFDMIITATDAAGNQVVVQQNDLNLTIDKTLPTISSAATGALAVTVTFSEKMDAATIAAADFTVAGTTVSAAEIQTDTTKVKLTIGTLVADAKPEVAISTVSDVAGNVITAASKVTATDGVKASLSASAVDKDLAIKADKINVTTTMDEKMATGWPKAQLSGPVAGRTIAVTSPTPNNYKAAITVSAAETTGIYGLLIQAKDLGANISNNATKVSAEVLSTGVGTKILTLGKGPIADTDLDGSLTDEITLLRNGTSTQADFPTITAVDGSARTVTLNSVATTTSNIWTATYHYIATETYEVDTSAPTVTFDPADGTSVANQSPYVRLVFDEDEYPGDSYKTVTLTKASLVHPSGTTTDALASFTTADSKEFIWAATDLALGKYELTVSATDTAGNKLTDSKGTFTITKRTTTINLRPGWNLISLPDSPAAGKTGINDVITSTLVDIVLTYDAAASNWYRATRQTDGTLGQPDSALELKNITSDKAYWVHSTGVVALKVDVPGLAAGAAALPPSFPVVAGWNLVPVATTDLAVTTRDADDYFSGLSWSRSYSYDNLTNKFVGLLPATSDTVSVTKGYWIFIKTAGTLVP